MQWIGLPISLTTARSVSTGSPARRKPSHPEFGSDFAVSSARSADQNYSTSFDQLAASRFTTTSH
jgi:hypothetical protein